jgi:hypothetical protein
MYANRRTFGVAVPTPEEHGGRDARSTTEIEPQAGPSVRGRYGGWPPVQRGKAKDPHTICFSETNPPILDKRTALRLFRYNELHDKKAWKYGGFVLENEPTGRG